MATLKNTTINDTSYIIVPVGTTAQRPSSPTVGYVRYNTDLGYLEMYSAGNNWIKLW
jgi:hypothetical protein